MLAHFLAQVMARLPTAVKYRLKWLRPLYIYTMAVGRPIVQIQTSAGTINWRINYLTSQEHLLATYEPYMQQAFQRFVRPGSVVYDIGAHAGFHALFAALLTGSSGQVIAFEPHPDNILAIRRQLSLNPHCPVRLLEYAASNVCQELHLDTSYGRSQGRISASGALLVKACTIDTLLYQDEILPPNVIKVDVEGHELQVLQGAYHTIRRYKPVILCDYNNSQTMSLLNMALADADYQVLVGPPVMSVPLQSGADR